MKNLAALSRLRPRALTRLVATAIVASTLAATPVAAPDAVAAGTTPPQTVIAAKADQFVTRSGSQLSLGGQPFRFAGTNQYYLGLDDNLRDSNGRPTYPTHHRIDNALDSAVRMGATVVRAHTLGISVGSPESVAPALGTWNDKAFESIDYAVAGAHRRGLRLMIPLTDQWRWYHGGKSTFTGWRGHANHADPARNAATDPAQKAAEANFYTDERVIGDFTTYISHILVHRNQYTGVALKDDPTIAVWETGNEIWDAPPAWTERIAAHIKSLAPRQLVADGSAATGKSVVDAAVNSPNVDIVGGHFYPRDLEWMRRDAAVAAAHGKAYVVGEYDWHGDLEPWLTEIEQNPNIAGGLFWTLLPRLEDGTPVPHDDGFQMWLPGVDAPMLRAQELLIPHAARMSATATSTGFPVADGAPPAASEWVTWASPGGTIDVQQSTLRLRTGTVGGYIDKVTARSTASRKDGGVEVTATPLTDGESYFSVLLRATGVGTSVGDAAGYRVEINSAGYAQVHRRGSRAAALSPGLPIEGFRPGQPVHLSFSVVGSRLTLSTWTGDKPPSRPTWTGRDTLVSAGGRAALVLNGGAAAASPAEWRVTSWRLMG